MKKKTTEEMMQDFLDKGGKIEKIPSIPYTPNYKVSSTTKKVPELKTLVEGELLYGVKKKVNKKSKAPDYSGIDMNLIPEHIKKLIKYSNKEQNQNKEEKDETNKDSRSSKADN